ncbi:MAG TPA: dihydroxyacetone kinase [Oscillibacter sp.]|jgi:DAK2 domain fusion protein YloV|nr:DAK2 domain-containing protein [Oscillospiraceae bacterium]HAT78317.1 dihydroxyacetone kinase [Oscillibacter sp.]HCQ50887.1 dihydroxyacetone kinase [Oscillibacter sp.]HJH82394.1 DAK2 domain-containing protein [Clostridiales bacterium]
MHDTINGAMFKEMLLFGTVSIAQAQQAINDLNVFPVPDGDTGTNMSLTIQTAAQELKKIEPATVDQAASVTASALLRGARGNSGVILSLLFRGISKELKGCKEADGAAFAAALQEGVAAAYNAVMKPAEGTILTVSRLAAERAVNAAEEHNSVEYVIEQAIAQGEITLAQTTDMNPVLKKAGVVDAGGKGFLLILGGMLSALRGEERPELTEENAQEKADFAMLNEEDITFTFDTVFIVRKSGRSIEPFRRFLDGIGDSLVIGEDDEAFKVHVHTDIPGEALTEAQKYGTLELAKIENMRTQAQQLAAGGKAQSTDDLEAIEQELEAAEHENAGEAEPEKDFGFLAVCAGKGLANVFTDLGADGVISGGQTMNPSTESILKEIKKVPAHTVFVLPNNKNIIMAAQQCIGLTEKTVVVIPTASIPQGVSAMMAVDPDMSDADAIAKAMTDAAQCVSTAQITYAARNSDFDGFDIHEGDYLALLDGKLLGTDRDVSALLDGLSDEAASREAEFITVFYGEDVNEEDARKACDAFTRKCPDAEVNLICGGQPVYYYIISIE